MYASVNRVNISSDNGLSPIRGQTIIWTSVGILWTGYLRTNAREIWIEIKPLIHENASENIFCEMAAILWKGDVLIDCEPRVKHDKVR